MKTIPIHIILLFFCLKTGYSQSDNGVVALDIPVRNSLTFNRYVANPTFSFVREQNKYITATSKREMLGIEDGPLTYFFNYSGRIKENIGAGIGVFQQNYGVLTTFGGIINFAYNARIQEDSNFTFGMNIGAYRSGLNSGNVITNIDDPALNNIPSNFLLTVNPGLNYGTGFMDFGISYNNIVTYNFNASALVEENPKQGLQGHIMYTGYIGGYGFFGNSKFSALAESEFQKETTIVSGAIMITIPKGIWAQVSYNTQYGASGGLGVNITPQIAIEYNYEKPFVGLSDFGASHEITLAYRFKNNNYYDYSRDDELAGLLTFEKKERKVSKTQEKTTTDDQDRIATEEQAMQVAEEQPRIAAQEQIIVDTEEQARLVAEEEVRIAAEKLLISNPTDNVGKSISALTLETERSNETQIQLIVDLESAVAIKENDLKELKEENDLSEQNIYVAPKPFKSLSEENEAIERLKISLDTIRSDQNKKIAALESLLAERVISFTDPIDETNLYFKNKINILKLEQEKAIRNRDLLVSSLEQISIATDFERKRRIKRATFDNAQDRYTQDRNTLDSLKQNVTLRINQLSLEVIDFGRERNNNIQILKNIEQTESGYYLILAIHSTVIKRDKFLVQVISSGNKEVDFFFNVSTSEYYIYSKRFDNINETQRELASKSDEPYNEKLNIIKIEN
ncbi:MAG: PorP/SprF family type IX secretion system membrane protein [Flavobacteriaceae bacterium]|nr:PorP/SprF family type IX secretion system membrane protein [Flavobacteriaceae bacterium]